MAELRRKNFQDLHIIWYKCQRELNLLRTMGYNYSRLRIRQEGALSEMKPKMRMVSNRIPRFKQLVLISLLVPEVMCTHQAGAKRASIGFRGRDCACSIPPPSWVEKPRSGSFCKRPAGECRDCPEGSAYSPAVVAHQVARESQAPPTQARVACSSCQALSSSG